MITLTRTPEQETRRPVKEVAALVEKAIDEITSTDGNITDELITEVCLKHNISEGQVRLVSGWNSKMKCAKRYAKFYEK